jgi:predicted nucleic acid-binding protein
LPALLKKRAVASKPSMGVLDLIATLVAPMELELYENLKGAALKRIAIRDADDWPGLERAKTLGCAVWTEDSFFLAQAWRLGQQTEWSCTSQTDLREFLAKFAMQSKQLQ